MSSFPEVTGERVIAERYVSSYESYLIYLFHAATYQFAVSYVTGRRALDFGCGSGYGTAMLAPYCTAIDGVDISPDAISYANARYHHPHLNFRTVERVETAPLPFQDQAFDVVLSFQVIEHIPDSHAYLTEVCRVLRPGGVVIFATPDRSTRLLPGQRPWNKFHVTEYSAAGLEQLLRDWFSEIDTYTMSGRADIIAHELHRTRVLKWLTLPFTFPGVPEGIRRGGIDILRALHAKVSKLNGPGTTAYDFDERDITIGRALTPSVNLIVVARN